VIVSGEIFLLSILVASLAGSAMGGEREEGKLEILASTPLSAGDIFHGKFTGVFYSLRFFWILIGVHIAFSLLLSPLFTSPFRIAFALLVPLLLVVSAGLVCAFGLFLSLFGRSTTLGVTASFGALALWWIGLPILFGLLGLDSRESAAGGNPFVVGVYLIRLWLPESDLANLSGGWSYWPFKALGPVVATLILCAIAALLFRMAFVKVFDRSLGRA
jgi:ABC-type transport system involved in multi-copper enzyme maturation permease subunit